MMAELKTSNRQQIETLCDLEIPYEIKISPCSSNVLYTTTLTWGHKKGKHAVSTIWLATLGKEDSARKITDGKSKERCVNWHPSKNEFAFISDRKECGAKSAIYAMQLADLGNALPLTDIFDQSIEKFAYSPDGKKIAFIKKDEVSDIEKRQQEEFGDMQVWGDEKLSRLRMLDLASGKTQYLELEKHVLDFCWSPKPHGDGLFELVLVTSRNSFIETPYHHGTEIHVTTQMLDKTTKICSVPGMTNDICWSTNKDGQNEQLYFRTGTRPDKNFKGHSLYSIETSSSSGKFDRISLGDNCDVTGLRSNSGHIVAKICDRLDDFLYVVGSGEVHRGQQEIEAFDMAKDPSTGQVKLAFSTSNLNEPMDIFSINEDGSKVRLSNHGESIQSRQFGTSIPLKCITNDEYAIEIDSLFISPSESTHSHKPSPTIVLIHGGPWSRLTNAFDPYYYMWAPYLLSQGYSILLTNYRGSSGRGERFATFSYDGAGAYQYQDIITATNYAIEQGLADPSRLIIGGISHGGLLTNICTVRNRTHTWRFKAAISMSGISDCDSMALTSDMGDAYQAELAGSAPWTTEETDTSTRKSSALWEFAGAMKYGQDHAVPPMLILHGAEDARVPVSQAWGLRRALEHYGLPFEMVIYPRQGHILNEQKFWIDTVVRVASWVERYIGPATKHAA